MSHPFRYFNRSPEVIRLTVMMYVRYPLSLRQVEDILFERGIDICHETVRFWWNRFGPMFANEIGTSRRKLLVLKTAALRMRGWFNASPTVVTAASIFSWVAFTSLPCRAAALSMSARVQFRSTAASIE